MGDITYIPMARGFVYLTAVVDWFSLQRGVRGQGFHQPIPRLLQQQKTTFEP
jgi:hypothetical protein